MVTSTTTGEIINQSTAAAMASTYEKNIAEISHHFDEANRLLQEMQDVFGRPFSQGVPLLNTTEWKRDAWRILINRMQLQKVWGEKRTKEYRDTFQRSQNDRDLGPDKIGDWPEITEEMIVGMVNAQAQSVPQYIDELIREQWVNWIPQHSDYVANQEHWKVSKKIIRSYIMDEWWSRTSGHRLSYDGSAAMRSLDNVFSILDGKGVIEHQDSELVQAVSGCNGLAETDYFKVRCYKNRNAHVYVKRLDLLDKFNFIGCGEGTSLPNPTGKKYRKKTNPFHQYPKDKFDGKKSDFFPSTEKVTDAIAAEVKRHARDVWGQHPKRDDHYTLRDRMILEPSAGEGAILYGLAKHFDMPFQQYTVENDKERAAKLNRKHGWTCHHADFLRINPFPTFDVIPMNPPFSSRRFMYHIHHAYRFLKRGGVLVAVAPPSWQTDSTRLGEAFREWLANDVGGFEWSPLPSRAFAQSGTNVETGLLTIRRDVEEPRIAIG